MTSTSMPGRSCFVRKHTSSNFVHQRYEELFELGRGTYGRVTLVLDRATGEKRVCKIVDITTMTPFEVELARREIRFLCELDHPRVVRLFEYADDSEKQQLVLILEYLSGGDCLRLLKGAAPPSEAMISRIIFQTLSTLAYCHERGVVHRDVKLENLILSSVPLRGQPDCRLIDFGYAARAHPLPRDILGTPSYMAPEVRRGQGYTQAADIWSVGVCAMELLSGKTPFGKPSHYKGSTAPILERLSQYKDFSELGELLQSSSSWAGRSAEAKDFVRRMLDGNLGHRLSMSEALNHPWMRQHQSQPEGLGEKLLDSLVTFADLTLAAKSCLCAIAAHSSVGEKEMRQVGKVFIAMDADCDGQISRGELARAVSSAGRLHGQPLDVQRLFNAMDFDQAGAISFTKFIAASMSTSFTSSEDLFLAAFHALDDSRRGAVCITDVQRLFPVLGATVVPDLPQDRDVAAKEWVSLLVTARRSSLPSVPSYQSIATARRHTLPSVPSHPSLSFSPLPERCMHAFNGDGAMVGSPLMQTSSRGVVPVAPSIACL